MTEYEAWCAKAQEGDCQNCGAQGLVFEYPLNPLSPSIQKKAKFCYICAHVPGANAIEYPDQHPYHSIIRPVLGALSLIFSELKKPKRPAKPKKPKGALSVLPMQPRRKKG